MKRRSFVRNTALGSAAILSGTNLMAEKKMTKPEPFKMKYAPHLGMFQNHAGKDEVDQLKFMADEGFLAFEDNGMKNREVKTQEAMAKTMAKRDLEMGVFVAHTIFWKEASLTTGRDKYRSQFLEEIKSSVEVAKRVNAKWMTVVPGHLDLRQDIGFQTAHVVESLKQASAILEPHGLVMVLEPLNFFNHPGLFLTKVPQAYEVCKAVDSPSCKILFDIYHQQIQEGNLIPNMDKAWEEVAYFQMGDNPGRKEPTTGEINYKNIFKHIHDKNFTGVLGMEHGNSKKGKEGERAVIDAYRECDNF